MSASDLARAGHAWDRAKLAERERMATLRALMVEAHENGMSEVQIARTAGVDRMTVRRALGKL